MPTLFPVFFLEGQGVDPKPSGETGFEEGHRRLCQAVIKSTKEGERRQGLQEADHLGETLPVTYQLCDP